MRWAAAFLTGWIRAMDWALAPSPARTFEDGVRDGMARGFAAGFDLAHEDPDCTCRTRAPFTR